MNSLSHKNSLGIKTGFPTITPFIHYTEAIEPLAMVINKHTNITGIRIADKEHQLSLYADDVILFQSSASTTLFCVVARLTRITFFAREPFIVSCLKIVNVL